MVMPDLRIAVWHRFCTNNLLRGEIFLVWRFFLTFDIQPLTSHVSNLSSSVCPIATISCHTAGYAQPPSFWSLYDCLQVINLFAGHSYKIVINRSLHFEPWIMICFTIFLASSCFSPLRTLTSFSTPFLWCPSFDRSKASGAIPCYAPCWSMHQSIAPFSSAVRFYIQPEIFYQSRALWVPKIEAIGNFFAGRILAYPMPVHLLYDDIKWWHSSIVLSCKSNKQ